MIMEFNDRRLKALRPPEAGQKVYVEKQGKGRSGRALALLHSYGGSRTWRVIYYVGGRPRGEKLGSYPEMSIAEARRAAVAYTPPSADADDLLTPGREKTFGEVAKLWLRKRVDERGLITAREIRRHLEVYVLPHWEATPIRALRRSNVVDLLDVIADRHGKPMADRVLTTLGSMLRWHQTRNDEFVLPLVRGMNVSEKVKRDRVLNDEEIRALWRATDEPTSYNGLIRFLLLSAQRWSKVVGMTDAQIVGGVWTLPKEAREKGTIGSVKLPQTALDVIAATPRMASSPMVFLGGAQDRRGPEKRNLDKRLRDLLPDMPDWVHHDLRRTARSLMARAGVPRDHAERVLGHVQPGVEGTYDRHDYAKEKADALEALARMIENILDPTAASNVVPLRARTGAG